MGELRVIVEDAATKSRVLFMRCSRGHSRRALMSGINFATHPLDTYASVASLTRRE